MDKERCKHCDFLTEYVGNHGVPMGKHTCSHPRYAGDEVCPITVDVGCVHCGEKRDIIFGVYCEGCGKHYTKRDSNEPIMLEPDGLGGLKQTLNKIKYTPGSVVRVPKNGLRGFLNPKRPDPNAPLIYDDLQEAKQAAWDKYFMEFCRVAATNSKCFSRKIGSVIVKDKAILSSGYNGPPRGVPQCYEKLNKENGLDAKEEPCCPRKKLDAASGTRLDLCYAQHAERNAITQAARNGVSVEGSTLYLNDIIPCKDCLGAIINAGIVEVVCTELKYYDADQQGKWLLDNSDLIVRVVYDAG